MCRYRVTRERASLLKRERERERKKKKEVNMGVDDGLLVWVRECDGQK